MLPTRKGLTRTLLAAALLLAAGATQAQEKPPVLFFAASSLQGVLNTIAAAWTKETGKRVVFSYAASSALARQVEQGAPADLFASADVEWMDYAQSKGLLAEGSRATLLGNTLVLIAAKDDTTALKIAPGFDLAGALGAGGQGAGGLGEGRLATGNPASVPVGKYAQAALTNLGVWDRITPKIAGTDNVRAALALVARGEARYGIVYGTDAKSEPRVRVVDTFPEGSHPKVVYPFARVKASANPDAGEFLSYLRTPAAMRIFESDGFTVFR